MPELTDAEDTEESTEDPGESTDEAEETTEDREAAADKEYYGKQDSSKKKTFKRLKLLTKVNKYVAGAKKVAFSVVKVIKNPHPIIIASEVLAHANNYVSKQASTYVVGNKGWKYLLGIPDPFAHNLFKLLCEKGEVETMVLTGKYKTTVKLITVYDVDFRYIHRDKELMYAVGPSEEDVLAVLGRVIVEKTGPRYQYSRQVELTGRRGNGVHNITPLIPDKVLPSDKGDELILRLRPFVKKGVNRSVFLVGAPGTGKCLGKGTPVIKYDGTVVPVEKIQDGDLVMGPDSQPRKVQGTIVGNGPLYRIVPVKGESWVCNDVHILTLVHTNSGEIIDIPLNEYLVRSDAWRDRYKLFQPDVINFEQGDGLPLDPYFLGVWLGDGTKRLSSVSVSKPDKEIFDICTEVAEKWGLKVRTDLSDDSSCPSYYLVGSKGQSNPLLNQVRDLMSEGACVPKIYKTASYENRMQVLAGLLDTDGSLTCNCFEIVQKSKKIAEGIMFLARSLGFKVTHRLKNVKGTDYHRMIISGDVSKIPLRIVRKRASPRLQIKNALRTGFKVESIGVGNYYGFALDGDGRFLLGDFTVTHNTCMTEYMSEKLGGTCLTFEAADLFRMNITQMKFLLRMLKPDTMIVNDIDRAMGSTTASALATLELISDLTTLMVVTANTSNLPAAALRPGRFDEVIPIFGLGEDTVKAMLTGFPDKIVEEVKEWPAAFINELVERVNVLGHASIPVEVADLKERVTLNQRVEKR